MSGKWWSPNDILYLTKYAGIKKLSEISAELCRSPNAIIAKTGQLRINMLENNRVHRMGLCINYKFSDVEQQIIDRTFKYILSQEGRNLFVCRLFKLLGKSTGSPVYKTAEEILQYSLENYHDISLEKLVGEVYI